MSVERAERGEREEKGEGEQARGERRGGGLVLRLGSPAGTQRGEGRGRARGRAREGGGGRALLASAGVPARQRRDSHGPLLRTCGETSIAPFYGFRLRGIRRILLSDAVRQGVELILRLKSPTGTQG